MADFQFPNDSNQSLRFSRSCREAFGYTPELTSHPHPDRLVAYFALFAAGFLFGAWIF